MVDKTIKEYGTNPNGQCEVVLRVNDVSGFPDTIVNDLGRADDARKDRIKMEYWWHEEKRESVVVIYALDWDALRWLYDWLEDTKQYYRREYVNAEGEYKSAKELADAVYSSLQD